jgi:hypothetical protein
MLGTINLEDLMPLEVDDEMILEDEILSSPPNSYCLTAGFNINSRVFWAAIAHPGPTVRNESACQCQRLEDPFTQLASLKKRLHDLKYMLDGIPSHFRQYAAPSTPEPEENMFSKRELIRSHVLTLRSNIHVTHIWLQNVMLDQIDAISQNLPQLTTGAPDSKDLWREREDLCRQLLHVLHSIPTANHEPNGCYLIHKVRDVAVALLTCPFQPEEEPGRRASEWLHSFTNILATLDNEFVNTVSLQSWVDTDRQSAEGLL